MSDQRALASAIGDLPGVQDPVVLLGALAKALLEKGIVTSDELSAAAEALQSDS